MSLFVIVAVCIALGILMALAAPRIKPPLLGTVVYWAGVVVLVVGLVLLLSPAILWLNAQLRAMLGV